MKSLKEDVIIFLKNSVLSIKKEDNDLDILHQISNLNRVLMQKVDYVLDNKKKFNLTRDQDKQQQRKGVNLFWHPILLRNFY